jgi:uncharacterized delta-60 repeat protein
MIEETLSFTIRNNTNGTVPISIFGNNADSQDNANVTTRYFWDVTSYAYDGSNSLSVTATAGGVTTTYNTIFSGNDLTGVVSALNLLNLGSFFLTTSGGNTFINNYNQNITFSNLVIGSATIFDTNFSVSQTPNNLVNAVEFLPDGKVVCVGSFTFWGTQTTQGIVVFNTDGTFDSTFHANAGTGFNGIAYAVKVQSDGKIIVGGNFSSYNSTGSQRIIRLNSNGTIDATSPLTGVLGGSVLAMCITSTNKIVAVGDVTATSVNDAFRLNSNFTLDGTFSSGAGFSAGNPATIVETNSGKYVIGGSFFSYDGNLSYAIVRINSNGSYDATFNNLGFNSGIDQLAYNSKGQFIAVGNFTDYGGNPCSFVVALDGNGNFDNDIDFGTGFDTQPFCVSVMSNDKILLGGFFLTYQGQSYPRIIRLNDQGSIDTSWVVGTGFDAYVIDLGINTANNQLACVGIFSTFQTYTCTRVAVLNL